MPSHTTTLGLKPHTARTHGRFMEGVVLVGNAPMLKTGYGIQLRLLGEHLARTGFKVAHICDFGYSGHMFDLDGVEVYGTEQLDSDIIRRHIRDWKARHRITKSCVVGLGNIHNWQGVLPGGSLLMFPVDGDGLKPEDEFALEEHVVAGLTRHGCAVLESEVLMPHGYDPVLVPSKSRRALRASPTFAAASGRFLVGFMGDMTIRKAPQQNLTAFARFSQDKDDVALWLQSSKHAQAEAVGRYLHALRCPVLATSEYDASRGLTSPEQGEILGALDVLLHASSQEGFGVYQIEAQACGTPVITSGFSSTKGLNAWSDLEVPEAGKRHANGTTYGIPDTEAIVQRLEALYAEWKAGKPRDTGTKAWAEGHSFSTIFEQNLLPAIRQHINKSQAKGSLMVFPPRKTRRVAFLSTWGTKCGIATYTAMLASEISKRAEVFVLAEATAEHPIGDYDFDGPVKVVYCWDRRFDYSASLGQALSQVDADVVHVQHEWALFGRFRDFWAPLRDAPSKTVFTYHTPDFDDKNEGALSQLLAHSSFIDAAITHNQSVAQKIVGKIMPPVAYIPHGVAAKTPSMERNRFGVPEGVPLLLNYGFASESKGTLDLIRAVGLARGRCPYFEVVIYAGAHPKWEEGGYMEECIKAAEGIPGLTLLQEFLPEENLDAIADASDFLVFPYAGHLGHELTSTSGAVMRVLGSAKPLIMTDEGRLRDFIGGVHGFKCSMRNPESLSQAIIAAVNSFQQDKANYDRMASAVRNFAQARAWPEVAAMHMDAYARVCAAWSVRPSVISMVRPVWVDHDAVDLLESEYSAEEEE